jgi:hypothetical protein
MGIYSVDMAEVFISMGMPDSISGDDCIEDFNSDFNPDFDPDSGTSAFTAGPTVDSASSRTGVGTDDVLGGKTDCG